jgi:hypothetical protein
MFVGGGAHQMSVSVDVVPFDAAEEAAPQATQFV